MRKLWKISWDGREGWGTRYVNRNQAVLEYWEQEPPKVLLMLLKKYDNFTLFPLFCSRYKFPGQSASLGQMPTLLGDKASQMTKISISWSLYNWERKSLKINLGSIRKEKLMLYYLIKFTLMAVQHQKNFVPIYIYLQKYSCLIECSYSSLSKKNSHSFFRR